MAQESKLHYVLVELAEHIPYSIFGVTAALVGMGVLSFLSILMGSEALLPAASMELFHVLHPVHILISTVVTTAMFWKHEKNVIKAIMVGFFGSTIICSVSDIFFPYIGGALIGADMHMHICILEEPGLVLPFAFFGLIAGFLAPQAFEKSTQYSHSAHVFVSSAASILYLLGFGMTNWMESAGAVFLITIFSVMIPCCTSDIVFPLACVHRNCDHAHEMTHEH